MQKMKNIGMTLMELILVIAIISITATFSINVYTKYLRKGRRIDGINSLLALSLAQERYRSNNSQYGTLAQVWNGVTTSPEGYYTLSISNITSSSYTAIATAVGNQTSDATNSVSCTPLQFAMNNGTITKSPLTCWPS